VTRDRSVRPKFEKFDCGLWSGEIATCFKQDLDPILELVEKGEAADILKDSSTRKVWMADHEPSPLCIKEFRNARRQDKVLWYLRGSRASLEWTRLTGLYRLGASVPVPYLWGERRTPVPSSVVVMAYVEGAKPLSEVKREITKISPTIRQEILIEAGAALARLHKAGGLHGDAHMGNLLLSGPEGAPRVTVVDLHQVHLHKKVPWKHRLQNLGEFLGNNSRLLSVPDKQRALQSYLETIGDWDPPFSSEREARRSMGKAIELYARKSSEKLWRRRMAKCQEEGKHFHKISRRPYSGWIRSEADHADLLKRLEDPNGWLSCRDCAMGKDTPTTTVARAVYDQQAQPVFLKRYNRKSLWERCKNLFRRSRAMRVWRSGYALEMLGIPTPRTICVLEKRVGPLLLESFILTEWIEGSVGLDDFFRDRCAKESSDPLDNRERTALRREIARLFRELHSHGISHGDLKGRNILVDPGEPAPFSPRFADLDALTTRPVRFKRSRINDLSRLLFSVYPHASLLEQVRFFQDYARGEPALWEDRRGWFKAIARRTRRKLVEKGLV